MSELSPFEIELGDILEDRDGVIREVTPLNIEHVKISFVAKFYSVHCRNFDMMKITRENNVIWERGK